MAGRLFGALMLAIGALALSTAWVDVRAPVVLSASVLLPYALLIISPRLRVATPLAVGIVLALSAAGAFWVGTASGLPPVSVVFDAVPRLLTAPRPAPTTPDLLVAGGLLGVVVGTLVGVRASRPGGAGYAPVVGGVVLYLAGALLTAGGADRHGVLALALVAVAVSAWVVRESAQRRGRLVLRAVPLIALGVAVSVAATVAMPDRDAFEPRELVLPPPLPYTDRNPLPRLAAFADRPDVELFRHSGSDRGERLHLLTLVEFDGASWQASGRYRPVGVVPPAVLPPGLHRNQVNTEITIGELDGLWLPARGQPTAVTLREARVDAQSGALAFPEGLRQGLRYGVSGLIEAPEESDLALAGVPGSDNSLASPYREVPRLPYLFADYAQRAVRGASTPFEQAVLIEGAVRSGRRFDSRAPVGSSYARLSTFLVGDQEEPGAQVGSSEQFAAAFAVLARAIGLPTRLTVGFRPGTRAADNTWVVRGGDALVWPEVYFDGQGWVPFDPTPSIQDGSSLGDDIKRQVLDRVGRNQPDVQPPPATPPPPRIATPGPNVTGPVAAPADPGGFDVSMVAGLAGVLFAVILGSLAVARAVRSIRHRRAGPRGAWSEVLDLLLLAGRPPPRWRSTTWIGEDLAAAFPTTGAHPAVRLAAYADRATFAPPGPPLSGGWADVRRLRLLVARAVPWYRRITWVVDPRPLRRR